MENYTIFEFFASRLYVNVTKEGPGKSIFDPIEAPSCDRSVMQQIHGNESENQIRGINKEGNCPVLP